MPIAITPDQLAMQASIRDWAKQAGPVAAVRRLELDPAGPARNTYLSDLADLGIFSISIPAEAGGAGGTVTDLAAALEQLTIALVPGPVTPNVLAGLLLTAAGSPLLPALAAGQATAAVGLTAGTLTGTRAADGTLHVTGQAGPVLGAGTTSHLILGCTTDEGEAWFQLEAGCPGLTVTSRLPVDFSRSLADVSLAGAVIAADQVLTGQQSARVRDLAATLFAAEAAGVAAWCGETAAGYAGIRRQFGRPIGSFQAVKHLCATMACRAERAAALAWDAARAADEAPSGHPFAAAAAAALALDDAVDNAKDCIQVLGGIGFTWEHDAHLYLRRALALRQLLGGTPAWRKRLATLAATGRPRGGRGDGQSPREQGGSGGDRSPRDNTSIGAWAGPAIEKYGSQAQQDRFLAPTRDGRITWCQLFSEPEAGSDLASLRTRAERTEAGWRLTGQKVWTSLARQADWAICLARTDPDVPKHQGISYFLVDMHAPGIDIRPLREITGRTMFNEVFLDDVFVPDDCLLGGPGEGWRIAMSTLSAERVAIGTGPAQIFPATGPEYSERAGYHLACGHAVALLGERGAHPAIRKLLGTAHRQEAAESALEHLGPAGAAETEASQEFLLTRCLSIAGGTTQILLTQVAERVLGLPPVMDFTLAERQQAVADLAAEVLSAGDPWKELARAGLLDVSPPDGLGVLEVAVLLTEVGRRAPSMKALATLMTGALPLARWGRPALLPAVASGELILTAALREPSHPAPLPPVTAVTNGTITGRKIGVPYAAEANLLLIPALFTPPPAHLPPASLDSMIMGSFDHIATETTHDHGVALVRPDAEGVRVTRTPSSSGEPEYALELDHAPVEGMLGGAECVRDLYQLAVAGACALADGVVAGALALTRDHVASREQFGRPLAAFQAVSQQIADVYIASRTMHLAALSACWRLGEDLDAAADLEVARYWCAEQATRSVRLCHHLHGGIGMDVTYPLHRFSSLAADLARFLGGAALPCSST